MLDVLFKIAIQLRMMQLASHHIHHIVSRALFFQDHEAFSDFYKQLEDDYDGVAERIVGFSGSLDIQLLNKEVFQKLNTVQFNTAENKDLFKQLLILEKELCSLCNLLDKSPDTSSGTKQLVGDICNLSEIRQYKIKQRIK